MDDKVFDEVISENQHALCNDFYDELFNAKTNILTNCEEPFDDYGLVLDYDIYDMCDYNSECSFEYNPSIHKDTHLQGMCDPFPHVEYKAFVFETGSMHHSFF